VSGNDEQRITIAAVSGDLDALTRLLHDSSPALRARLSGKIASAFSSVLDADDILQVTYLEAFQRIESFDPKGPGAFLAWITRIADNNLLDAIRELERAKRPPARKRVHSNNDSSVALYDRLLQTTTTPSRKAVAAEIHDALTGAISQLPEDYAEVIRLYELQGLPVAEVATILGRSEGAVFMLRARALDRLREVLGQSTTR
jgi:RNA polymerase sigma-70 factor (ECF subfamily)